MTEPIPHYVMVLTGGPYDGEQMRLVFPLPPDAAYVDLTYGPDGHHVPYQIPYRYVRGHDGQGHDVWAYDPVLQRNPLIGGPS